MIDLAPAYQRVTELLARAGLAEAPYCVTLEVWNLRNGAARVTFNVIVYLSPRESFGAFTKPTIEAALAELDRMLQARGPVTPPFSPAADLKVSTP